MATGLRGLLGRAGAAATNALEVVRFGGLRTDEESSPYALAGSSGIAELRRYFPETTGDRPVVLLVPPLMLTAEIWDVAPTSSAVRALHGAGLDPWVVDFGSPEHVEGGRSRTIADHVIAIADAVDLVADATGRDVHLGGYSQGGMFAYQVAAYRRSARLASVITFGSPVDAAAGLPLNLPQGVLTDAAASLARVLFSRSAVPGWLTSTAFKLLDPVKTVRSRLDFVRQLHDRETLVARESQRRFLDGEGFIAWPGPALAEFAEQFLQHNRLLQGGVPIGDRVITLADLETPLLAFLGENDEFAVPRSVRGIRRAAPRADAHEVTVRAGHFGLVVGSRSEEVTWPAVASWVFSQETGAPLEAPIVPMRDDDDDDGVDASALAQLALDAGGDVARNVARAAARSWEGITGMAEATAATLPRLLRLERVDADTRVSLGAVLQEQAEDRPDATFFLFEGRGYTYAAANRRVDNVVRGLLSLGVRQGEHVGVLMHTRPSGLATLAAINRLGAVSVLLRPSGDLQRELELGGVGRVVVDPDHLDHVRGRVDVPVLCLGGGGQDRDLGPGVTDMERIDPDVVVPPSWYRPNPGRASDLGFVLFTGAGETTRTNLITNRRWTLSAFGTASAGNLGPGDTVYGITPLHHPSGLLTAVGGGLAGGARIALTNELDPEVFWEEVRRYGVTVVAYTWTLCRALVDAPSDPRERHHPIRLFLGSGMPAGVWRRVQQRYSPAQVLEFYASTEGQAVLVNLGGRKVGARGRPLPGSTDVAVARYDPDAARLVVGDDGYAQRCAVGETGLLLARVPRGRTVGTATPLRSVFEPDDAWLSTGDLFHVDADGDHWLDDNVVQLIRTREGHVPTMAMEDVVGVVPGVSLAVGYGVPAEDGTQIATVAVTLRPGHDLDVDALSAAVRDGLSPAGRPRVVRVVDEIEVTTWYRPVRGPLREAGLPARRAWEWDPVAQAFHTLTAARRDALLGG